MADVTPIRPPKPQPTLPMKIWVESGPTLVFPVKNDNGEQWSYPLRMSPQEARRVASWLTMAADDAESGIPTAC